MFIGLVSRAKRNNQESTSLWRSSRKTQPKKIWLRPIALIFQIGLNPFLNSHTPLILLIKTHAKALVGFAPADSPANPNARKSQQRKRNFDGRAGRYLLITAHRHAAGTELMAGGGEPVILGGGQCNFSHNRNANIA